MSKGKFHKIGAVSLLAVLALAGGTSGSLANHPWGSYHWARQTNPFTLKLGNNLTTQEWRDLLAVIVADWNDPSKASQNNGGSASQLQPYNKPPVIRVMQVAGTSGSNCAAVNGTTQVCNGNYGSNGWLGLATISVASGGHIVQGTAKMNDSYFANSYYNNVNERRHVICQEVAHSFGLGHQSTNGSSQNSCMDYFANVGSQASSTKSTRPNYHDFEQLNAIYAGHTDSTTSVRSMAGLGAFSSGVTADPKTWGKLVHQSASGLDSLYSKPEANGVVTYTHVIWAKETAAMCPSCDHRGYKGP